VGAEPRVIRPKVLVGAAAPVVVLFALALAATPVAGQEPPDSLPPDSLPQQLPDSLVAEGDTLEVDSLPPPIRNLPEFGRFGSADDPGVMRVWELDDLLGARETTLQELLETLPVALPIRGGDYGTPENVVAVGLGGGRVRVFTDGVEELPLDGSVADLSRIPLAGIGRVVVRRAGGELRVEMETERADEDPRPLTRISAGTGDLDTNIFRGVFLQPNALGGALGVAIERIDSRGRAGQEEGTLRGVWLRYLRPVGAFTVAAELRRGGASNPIASIGATESTRSSWTLRARAGEPGGLRGEVYWSDTGLDLEGGTGVDGREFRPARLAGSQLGARGAWDRTTDTWSVWARGEARRFGGESRVADTPRLDSILASAEPGDAGARPDDRFDLDLGFEVAGLGGAAARLGSDGWEGGRRQVAGIRAWTAPVFGVSLYASHDRGERGWRPTSLRLPADSAAADSVAAQFALPPDRFTDVESSRVGARVLLGPLDVRGAWLSLRTDSVFPLGTADRGGLDARGGVPFAGDEVTGFEVEGRLGLPLIDGLAAVGSLQQWEEEGVYRPERIYRGGLDFANTYYDTGNLEIRMSLLVEGRDSMLVAAANPDFLAPPDDPDAIPGPARVPFYQSWNAHLQIRVVSVRIFVNWENVFGRRALEDVPGRVMPGVRASYGVRWTFRN
jgi:hypothetical protein